MPPPLGKFCLFTNNPYSSCVTECYRQSCVQDSKERAREVCDLNKSASQKGRDCRSSQVRVSVTEVIIYKLRERMRFCTAQAHAEGSVYLQQQARSRWFCSSLDDALKTFGVHCREVAHALSHLAERKDFFDKRKHVNVLQVLRLLESDGYR